MVYYIVCRIHPIDLNDRGEEIPEESELLDVDIILASDCVYLEVAFIPLLETLLALAKKDTVIYLAYKKRRKADKRFFQLARKKFELIEVLLSSLFSNFPLTLKNRSRMIPRGKNTIKGVCDFTYLSENKHDL